MKNLILCIAGCFFRFRERNINIKKNSGHYLSAYNMRWKIIYPSSKSQLEIESADANKLSAIEFFTYSKCIIRSFWKYWFEFQSSN
jgi:hypothetical protein